MPRINKDDHQNCKEIVITKDDEVVLQGDKTSVAVIWNNFNDATADPEAILNKSYLEWLKYNNWAEGLYVLQSDEGQIISTNNLKYPTC